MERAPAGCAPAIQNPISAACPARPTHPYLHRRAQATPLYRVLADHFSALETVPEEQ